MFENKGVDEEDLDNEGELDLDLDLDYKWFNLPTERQKAIDNGEHPAIKNIKIRTKVFVVTNGPKLLPQCTRIDPRIHSEPKRYYGVPGNRINFSSF